MRILLAAVVLCACIHDPEPPAPETPDGGMGDAGSAAPSIADVLDCGTAGSAGGLPAGNDLRRIELDPAAFPSARCNDGTQAVFYVRPAATVAGRSRWMIQLQGGGGCHDAATCAKRWCSVDSNIGMEHMTARMAPTGLVGQGVLARDAANPYADANHVLLRYCSSDNHGGRTGPLDVETVHPVTGDAVKFRIEFHGRDILDAVIATLRKDGGPIDATLPDLDDATDVVLAGASAGGGGVIGNADYLEEILRTKSTNATALRFVALIDSTFSPANEALDWGTSTLCTNQTLCTWQAILTFFSKLYARETDASCMAWHAAHAPGSEWLCQDSDHIVRNHVTTPFFMRQGLRDRLLGPNAVESLVSVPGRGLMTEQLFTSIVHDDLLALANLRTTAEEAAAITTTPGAFGPPCMKHETLSDNANALGVSVTTSGTAYTMFGLFSNWQRAQGVSSVVYDPTMTATCP